MDVILEFVLPNKDEAILVITNPPAVPCVGDLTLGPDGTVFMIKQRAYLVREPKDKLGLAGGRDAGGITWQCVLIPVELLEVDDQSH